MESARNDRINMIKSKNSLRQKVVPVEKVKTLLKAGWEYSENITPQETVVKLPDRM